MERCSFERMTTVAHDVAKADDEASSTRAEIAAALRLLSARGIGPARMAKLVECIGSAVAAENADPSLFAHAAGLSLRDATDALVSARGTDVAPILNTIAAQHASIEIRGVMGRPTCGYPDLLHASPDPPWLLFVKGALTAVPEPTVAIVGSRRASSYGRLHAGRLAGALAERGVTVVSGGARGIDAEAHRAALRARGRTIAVVASGFEHPYPPEHAELYEAIVEAGGAVVTEQLPSIEPRAELFPRRNRIIAALSFVTVVVEAAERSGALLTARIAVDDLSRDVGCLPGSVDSLASAGCHRAIREGWATLIRNADDICEMIASARTLAVGAVEQSQRSTPIEPVIARTQSHTVRSSSTHAAPADKPRLSSERALSVDARAIVEAMRGSAPYGLDELESQLEWSVQRIAVALLELEMAGAVGRDGTGAYRVLSRG